MAQKSKVVLFACVKDNKVLVEKRPVRGFVNHQYLIPGGAINTVESLDQALKREMKEELGIIPVNYQLLTEEDLPGLYDNILKPFIVTAWSGEIPEVILDKEDPHSLEWLDLDNALKITLIPTRKIIEEIKNYLASI